MLSYINDMTQAVGWNLKAAPAEQKPYPLSLWEHNPVQIQCGAKS